MNDDHTRSRVNKFEKRRKNTKAITIFTVLGSLLLLVLLVVFVFGGNKDKSTLNDDNNDLITENNNSNNLNDNDADNVNTNKEENTTENESQQTAEENNSEEDSNDELETVEHVSDDENVISAFSKDWDPIGTNQSEPHTVQYDDGTQDRIEMEQAAMYATGLDEIITWWLENGGDQKVIATITPRDQTENYRVYISWIENEGWKPTKVEVLQMNDKHPDYQDEEED